MAKEKFQPEESANVGQTLSSHDEGKQKFSLDKEKWFAQSDKSEQARKLGVFTAENPITEAGSVTVPDTERMKFIVETARQKDQRAVEDTRQKIRKMFMRPEGARPSLSDEDTLADDSSEAKRAA